MKKEKFKSMEQYFDSVLDPFNFTTIAKHRTGMDLERAIKWYQDSSIRYAHKLMGSLKGKHVLDIGCGMGTHLIWLARNGAKVTGIDISSKRVDLAKKIIEKEGFEDSVSVYVRDGQKTDFPEGTFDIIYGQDILMFLEGNFDVFTEEMKRILKKGGALIFSEALEGHPIAKWYRRHVAPGEWKEFTHYFRLKYLDNFRRAFSYVDYRTFYLTGFFLYAVKVHLPFYWLFSLVDNVLSAIDSLILKILPGLKKYCWRIIFIAKKK